MKKIKDTDIARQLGIPITTIQDWKKSDKNGWRYNLYMKLKTHEGVQINTDKS